MFHQPDKPLAFALGRIHKQVFQTDWTHSRVFVSLAMMTFNESSVQGQSCQIQGVRVADLHQLGEGSSTGGQVHSAVQVLNMQTFQAPQAGDGGKRAVSHVAPVAAPEDGEGLQAVEQQATHDAEGHHSEVVLVH